MTRALPFLLLSLLMTTNPALSASPSGPAKLTVSIQAPTEYRNARGDRIWARYGSLSDDSLHFVKVRLPNGSEYTLPLAMSASGARYTDEREVVWWEHQGKVSIEMRGPDGDWKVRYEGLVPVKNTR